MKKQYLAAMMVISFIAVFLCSCSSGKDEETTTEAPNPWSEAEVFEAPTVPVATTTAKGETTAKADNSAVLDRINTANRVYSLFYSAKPKLDKSDSTDYNEMPYYRVVDENMDTPEKFRAYLGSFFSEEIVNRLLAVDLYAEFEGKLYAADVSMDDGSRKVLSREVTAVKQTDTTEKYTLKVSIDTDGDGKADLEKTGNYTYSLVESTGKWVFTQFDFI